MTGYGWAWWVDGDDDDDDYDDGNDYDDDDVMVMTSTTVMTGCIRQACSSHCNLDSRIERRQCYLGCMVGLGLTVMTMMGATVMTGYGWAQWVRGAREFTFVQNLPTSPSPPLFFQCYLQQ